MKTKILIVDNKSEQDEVICNMKAWVKEEPICAECSTDVRSEFKPQVILEAAPDLVILDVALRDEEEQHFGPKSNSKPFEGALFCDISKPISGIEYCRRLKASFPQIPVVLVSWFFHSEILSAALEAGADGFLHKQGLEPNHFKAAVHAMLSRSRTGDVAFYELLRELLGNESSPAWEREQMIEAMHAFFKRGAGPRRLTGLWCNLAELVEKSLPGEVVNNLLRALMDTEAMLMATDPRMRDHVRHSGNVFWLGYFLLNRVAAFQNPASLPGFLPDALGGPPERAFERLNIAWLLASLLHDVGYLRDRIGRVRDRLARTAALFTATESEPKKTGPKKSAPLGPPIGLEVIQKYLQGLGSDGKLLYGAIDHTLSVWRTSNGDRGEDHGLASASALVNCLKGHKDHEACLKRPEVLHAISAIALHNLPKWNKEWPATSTGQVSLNVGMLPAAWLLAYCDELQGWGREAEADPFEAANAKVTDARMIYKRSYINGSRICSFRVDDSPPPLLKVRVEIGIQHMLAHGEHGDEVGKTVREGIQEWRREKAPVVRHTLNLDKLIETTITHWVPAVVSDPIPIMLDGREPL